MALKAVGIWHNAAKEGVLEVTKRLTGAFLAGGVEVYMTAPLHSQVGGMGRITEDFHECELLAVLGGDGTLLNALDIALQYDIPLLGINMGRVGFLSEVPTDQLELDIRMLLEGRYTLDERMLLKVDLPGMRREYVLNEVAFNRANTTGGLVTLTVSSGGVLINRFSGDGLIVCSTTGSTAYSLSAGGPIVSPQLNVMVVTPICSHTPTARPVVVSSEERLTVEVVGEADKAFVTLDGFKSLALQKSDGPVAIEKAQKTIRFIRFAKHNYYDLLRRKLSDWTR